MNSSPRIAKGGYVGSQLGLEDRNLPPRAPVVLAQLGRPVWAAQIKDRLAVRANHVHVRRTMVVGIDHHPEATNPFGGRHYSKNPSVWVIVSDARAQWIVPFDPA
jgi:hypothetical protein